MNDWAKIILGGTAFTAIVTFIASQLDWIRFSKKDRAAVKKVESEVGIDLAEITNKAVDAEIKISKAALEWTVQMAQQLDKANDLADKRQTEINRMQEAIYKMREDFEKRVAECEQALEKAQNDLDNERTQNQLHRIEIDRLTKQLNNNGTT